MSNKKRKAQERVQKKSRPRRIISSQQETRLQRAARAQSAGDLVFAESEYRALAADKVMDARLYGNLGLVCASTGRQSEARRLWRQALTIDPGYIDAAMNLAASYQQAGRFEKAIECYRRVLSKQPDLVAAKYLLANLLKAKGEFKGATACYQQVIAQQPDYTQAHFTYSGIHKYRDRTDPHIELMLDLYKRKNLSADGRIQLAFALAKAFEDIEDYPQAFEFMKTGNRMRCEKFDYRIEGDQRLIENIISMFDRDVLENLRIDAESSNRPIFIIGMPRSGTSLVEKILSSHSDVHGAGELEYFHALVAQQFMPRSGHFQFNPLDSYAKSAFENLGRAYVAKLDSLGTPARRITDKMPFNMLLAGLIKIALPNARIIHCVREAKDNCLSIFKTNFATGNYRFAYDLRTLGQFHNLYRKLMKHWHQVMPGAIYDIEYENLTQSPEREIRNLVSACGLEWEDACLDFDKSAGIVKTASFFQVRQPMYTSSVSLWEKYREFLQPLFDELG